MTKEERKPQGNEASGTESINEETILPLFARLREGKRLFRAYAEALLKVPDTTEKLSTEFLNHAPTAAQFLHAGGILFQRGNDIWNYSVARNDALIAVSVEKWPLPRDPVSDEIAESVTVALAVDKGYSSTLFRTSSLIDAAIEYLHIPLGQAKAVEVNSTTSAVTNADAFLAKFIAALQPPKP